MLPAGAVVARPHSAVPLRAYEKGARKHERTLRRAARSSAHAFEGGACLQSAVSIVNQPMLYVGVLAAITAAALLVATTTVSLCVAPIGVGGVVGRVTDPATCEPMQSVAGECELCGVKDAWLVHVVPRMHPKWPTEASLASSNRAQAACWLRMCLSTHRCRGALIT